MESNAKNTPIKVHPKVFFGALQEEAKRKQALNPKKEIQINELPMVTDLLMQIMTPGTVYSYPGKPVVFNDSTQQAVKSLKVTFSSTQSTDMAMLHQLHTKVRNFE